MAKRNKDAEAKGGECSAKVYLVHSNTGEITRP